MAVAGVAGMSRFMQPDPQNEEMLDQMAKGCLKTHVAGRDPGDLRQFGSGVRDAPYQASGPVNGD